MSLHNPALSRSAEIHRSLDHPIIDSDGHHVEYQPAVFDVLAYRRALHAALDYTSPHYIPHPIRIASNSASRPYPAQCHSL